MSHEDSQGIPARPFSKALPLLLFVLALVLRIYWLATQVDVLDNEGAEYVRIAENLLQGNGYRGTYGNPQLVHAPLHPFLIAGLLAITGRGELAGPLASVLMGAALVLPVTLISRRIYGQGVALIAGLLTAVHPSLLWLSVSASSEATYVTLMMFALYAGLRALYLATAREAVLAGILLGLAYLARPSAVLITAITLGGMTVAAVVNRSGWRRLVHHGSGLLIPFVFLVLPYALYGYSVTGQFRLEYKSHFGMAITRRMVDGMSYAEAARAIGQDLTILGAELDHTAFALQSTEDPATGFSPGAFLTSARQVIGSMGRKTMAVLTLPILLLALPGLVLGPWTRRRLFGEGYLLLVVAAFCVSYLMLSFFWVRYAAPFLPLAIIWAARGVERSCAWAEKLATRHRVPLLGRRGVLLASLALLVLLLQVWGARLPAFTESRQDLLRKEAGLWLQSYRPGPKQIMDSGTLVPYYSGGTLLVLPYASEQVAMRYIGYKDPDFVVLSRVGCRDLPYLCPWVESGIPEAGTHLVYSGGNGPEEVIQIYERSAQ